MSMAIPPSIRCLGIFTGIIVMLVLLVLGAVLIWQERDTFYQDKIDKLADQLRRFKGVIATIPTLEKHLADLQSNKDLDAYYLGAADGAMAGIILQRRIEDFARAVGVSLSSVQVLPPEDQPAATKIGIRLRFGCSAEALWQLLYDIEGSKPLLTIPVITIRSMHQGGQRRSYRNSEDGGTPDLNINMDIYGYIRRTAV